MGIFKGHQIYSENLGEIQPSNRKDRGLVEGLTNFFYYKPLVIVKQIPRLWDGALMGIFVLIFRSTSHLDGKGRHCLDLL